jgi:hypothetical protein
VVEVAWISAELRLVPVSVPAALVDEATKLCGGLGYHRAIAGCVRGGSEMGRIVTGVVATALVSLVHLEAQQRRPASPEGTASTQVNSRWIDIVYGRPILRGRTNIFGAGADYGKTLFDGGTVWRAGANVSTRLRSEVALEIGGKTVPAGEHVMLIDLKSEKDWTLILTSQSYALTFDPQNTKDLYGGYNYRPDFDVARAPMSVERLPYSVDQLTWWFTDVTASGGTFRIAWERMTASAPFRIVN